jgi:pimeloyl-ACP methyl ester carboxylesterase
MPKQRIGDVDLYYETVGQGQPILFIHGLGSSARDWEIQVDFFSRNYQVVTIDVRGHGRSDKPAGPYSIALFARDVTKLINALGIIPVHIVGISMGGMIAFQLAVSEPELIKSLVIVNAAPEFVIRTMKERLQAFQRLLIVQLISMRKMGEVLSKRLFPKQEQEELRELLIERWAQNDPKAYMASMKAILGWSVADQLSEIKCPVLVIASDEDYTPIALKESYVARIPNGEMKVIKDSRHATPVDQPDKFNQTVMAFLSKQG